MRTFLYSVLVILSLLGTSCSDNEPGNSSDIDLSVHQNVYLKLSTEIQTRLDAEPSQVGTSAPLYSAILYFLDDADDPLCWQVKKVGTDGDISTEQFLEGAILGGIPVQVTQVYVVGNYNSSDAQGKDAPFPLTSGVTLSQIKATALDINQVAYWQLADGTSTASEEEENIKTKISILDGMAPLQEYGSNPQGWKGGEGPAYGDMYAEVSLSPLIARLEFYSFSVFLQSDEYTMDGIYINYFYPKLPLSLDPEGYTVTNNGNDPERYDVNSSLFTYTNYRAMYNPIRETVNNPDEEDIGFEAGFAEERFTFHVFGGSPSPQVVFRFTDITFRDGTTADERYATITRFLDQDNNEITTFERNTIYSFRNIDIRVFTETPDPGPQIELTVHVEIRNWINVVITPPMNN
ncbi:MAG: hypothetical protein LIP08_00120 [Bacteroides sp.]|nr:hypothetical protein [Bacteroides sp.]